MFLYLNENYSTCPFLNFILMFFDSIAVQFSLRDMRLFLAIFEHTKEKERKVKYKIYGLFIFFVF